MIRIGELAEMRYLRLLLGFTMLDCQRKCNINRLEMDNIVILKTLENNWLDDLTQMHNAHHRLDTVCTVHLVHFIVSIQQIHNTFNNNYNC